jgi:hypothetical protein
MKFSGEHPVVGMALSGVDLSDSGLKTFPISVTLTRIFHQLAKKIS